MGLQKAPAQEIALENRLPMVTLAESAGANLQYQSELFVEGGRTFARQAKLSATGIPQVTVVHGSSTAGGAYVPGLSDYVIMVRERAKVFLAGLRSFKLRPQRSPQMRSSVAHRCIMSPLDSMSISLVMIAKRFDRAACRRCASLASSS